MTLKRGDLLQVVSEGVYIGTPSRCNDRLSVIADLDTVMVVLEDNELTAGNTNALKLKSDDDHREAGWVYVFVNNALGWLDPVWLLDYTSVDNDVEAPGVVKL